MWIFFLQLVACLSKKKKYFWKFFFSTLILMHPSRRAHIWFWKPSKASDPKNGNVYVIFSFHYIYRIWLIQECNNILLRKIKVVKTCCSWASASLFHWYIPVMKEYVFMILRLCLQKHYYFLLLLILLLLSVWLYL